jgi:hypothetical protein
MQSKMEDIEWSVKEGEKDSEQATPRNLSPGLEPHVPSDDNWMPDQVRHDKSAKSVQSACPAKAGSGGGWTKK